MASKSGTAHAVIMWWILEYDDEILLSTAPSWVKGIPTTWRDHWIQAVFYLKEPVELKAKEPFNLFGFHDDLCIWFDVNRDDEDGLETSGTCKLKRPVCTCGAHTIWNDSRLWQLNDAARTQYVA